MVVTARNESDTFVQLFLSSLVNHAIAEIHANEEVAHKQRLVMTCTLQNYEDEQAHYCFCQHDRC